MHDAMSEAAWEEDALEQLHMLGWRTTHGSEVAPGTGERETWDDPLIKHRLLDAMRRLNPQVPASFIAQAAEEIASATSQDAIAENKRIHDILTEGYRLTYIDADGQEQNPTLRVLGATPEENDWLAVNQLTVRQRDTHRRFDLVLYVNGMPLSIIELKRPTNYDGVIEARAQLTTYVDEFPLAFRFAAFVVVSDGFDARYGTPFTPLHHFSPWNVDDDGRRYTYPRQQGGVWFTAFNDVLDGLFNQERMLELLRSFVAFDEGDDALAKRIAKPHQYIAVNKAVRKTLDAVTSDGRAGVVWHTQGSGKSMEMELYANLVCRHPQLHNPTIVVVTDRTELDGQLFETFQRSTLLPEQPRQVTSRVELRQELSDRTTGGIYFTTLQKFGLSSAEKSSRLDHPLLSDRRNVIVIVDEAHRSHYDDVDGYARYLRDALPHATLIAFTGTPISLGERDTRAVFGDDIDVYDLSRAVDDGATVPVRFEPRLVTVGLSSDVSDEELDRAADEATTGLDDVERARVESSVAVINAVYGAPERIAALAEDIIVHWEERRDRMRTFIGGPGKALIVGGTRKICADLYAAIVERRPDWHDDALDAGRIKVVYSAGKASDDAAVRAHARRESENKAIKKRIKDPADELELVIVKDMMLTGFDAPALHTLYLDRPLKGALLMQTLARVNRTFHGKQDGLLVAFAPITENLKNALAEYTADDQENRPVGRDTEETAEGVREAVALARQLLDPSGWRDIYAAGGRYAVRNALGCAANYLRDPHTPGNSTEGESLASRFRRISGTLVRLWALSSTNSSLRPLRDEVAFYENVRAYLAKLDAMDRQERGEPIPADVERTLAALIDDSTAADGVVDIYAAAGLPPLTLDELTPQVVSQAQQSPNPQLAIDALRHLLVTEASTATRGNLTRQRAFSDRISQLMNRYTNSQLTSAEVMAALGDMADEIRAEHARGSGFEPPLSGDELAFYDAIAENESAMRLQGSDTLAEIARELVKIMQRDVRTDWTVRENVRAKLRQSIKRLLVRFRYPPDKQPDAIVAVLNQMEEIAPRYAA
ncbi:DEAD/DEAH box helicase [Microbacterium faecale]|uniref:Type I restriction enzyme endonuclease subunit n=1 Tax=Microbacterium faecale TaxID=1804630 RepID=A0A917DDD3_9MICO|nr:type I restriction endonuclease subunit R [Microbacterium faecale]GGD28831.1 DEAD/DEAH box helicase [Microbacterium faecale]